jgi:hypothetical protein
MAELTRSKERRDHSQEDPRPNPRAGGLALPCCHLRGPGVEGTLWVLLGEDEATKSPETDLLGQEAHGV